MQRRRVAKAGVFLAMLAMSLTGVDVSGSPEHNIRVVAETEGLVAFWDFDRAEEGRWISVHDPELDLPTYPISLRQIGDPEEYTVSSWPYRNDESSLLYDSSGPFGNAVRFNQGHVYGAVEREDFDNTLLDLHGRKPLTLIAWTKFIGKRHLVAGIWDEGGWKKYGGRRQVALFAGLFGKKGTIAHISATGAASFPQSTERGAQFARLRAIDGQPFKNDEWVSMAMAYDPAKNEVMAYLNGKMTPLLMGDPVIESVYQNEDTRAANPFQFDLPIYSPRSFTLKFNGYGPEDGIPEHRLIIDLDQRRVTYERDEFDGARPGAYRVFFDVERNNRSLLAGEIGLDGKSSESAILPPGFQVRPGDQVVTRLEALQEGEWNQIGSTVEVDIQRGAPFTFGRALGLGSEDTKKGSQLYLDGVAVFNRVLAEEELKALSFIESSGD